MLLLFKIYIHLAEVNYTSKAWTSHATEDKRKSHLVHHRPKLSTAPWEVQKLMKRVIKSSG